MPDVKDNSKFSKSFLWGAATSAHQVEGGNHNQWTVWELENAKVKAAQAEYHIGDFNSWERIKKYAKDPHNYVSGNASNHYSDYKLDFDLLEKMHMNAFRFSVEWSRIEPREGVFDPKAIGYYREYVKELKKRGIEPIMTLFHFTLPVCFAENGVFEKRSNAKYFTRFARKIVSELGMHVKYIITINEPIVYVTASYINQEWPPMKQGRVIYWGVKNNFA
jgi:beta-glucosidase